MNTLRESQFLHRFAGIIGSVLLVLAFLCALGALNPATALAKSYTSGPVKIDATAQTDGDLVISEQRTFTFDGSFSCIWWSLGKLPDGAELKASGVSMSTANGTVDLPQVAFDTDWRDAGGPDQPSWSLDKKKNTIYAFFEAENSEVTFTVDYTVKHAIQVYSDTSELYWKFVGDGWAVDSSDVVATIHLPVAKGDSAVAGDTVKAWGHGALNGSVKINEDGTVVYKVPTVSAGNYAEARIAFPITWVPKVSSSDPNYHEKAQLDTIQREEEQWADEANNYRLGLILSMVASILVSIVAVVWALVRFFRYGRELKPTFFDVYWRDEPFEGAHPALVGRLMRFDDENMQDFSSTVLNLVNLGACRLEPVEPKKKGLFGKGQDKDFALVANHDFDRDSLGTLDEGVYSILFDILADKKDRILLSSLSKRAEARAEAFSNAIDSWQGKLSAEVIKADIIEGYSKEKRFANTVAAIVVVVVGVVLWFVFENMLCVIPTLIAAIVLVLVGRFMPRRTQKGADAFARSEGLKKWLCEFSTLNERPITDVKVWGKLMVYAYALGVAEEASKQLSVLAPRMFSESLQSDLGYEPALWWYYPTIVHSADAASTFDLGNFTTSLNDSLSKSFQAASSIRDGMNSDSDGGFSSGGGFGGGFSGGGGGGFGGGGGAR